jgi:SAM-dependent methyltransferase
MLEIGCGTGVVLGAMSNARPDLALAGSDLFVEALPIATRRAPTAELTQMDACHIPFTEEYDVVSAFDVLEHVEQDDKALAELFRATRRGGGVILTVPQHPWLWSVDDEYGEHVRRYRRGELQAKVRAAGFDVVRTTSWVSLVLPIMAGSRLRRRADGDYDPQRELKIGKRLDSALGRILAAEQALIRRGVVFPFGGSVLVVGRKP